MWKVGEKNTMKVSCNPESNFPISIELQFGGPQHSQEALDKSHGMWFDVEDAKYLIGELEKAVETMSRLTMREADLSKAVGPVFRITDEDIEAVNLL